MIEHLCEVLKRRVESLPFITLCGGLARIQRVKDNGIERAFPVMETFGGYTLLTPQKAEAGIAYFEFIRNDVKSELAGDRGYIYLAALRLVVWLNLERIDPPDVLGMQAAAMAAVTAPIDPTTQEDTGRISRYKITRALYAPKSPGFFAAYSYSEEELQYLMHPYDYFAIDFEAVYTMSNCEQPFFTIKPVVKC